jgi:NhaP-type Na+/H+ or K+/H+ antiporter
VTTDQILLGVGLTVLLAVGSQVLASRLRIPALIVLLPVGFAAGALTDTVNPNRLLGHAFQPLVALAVAVILYDSGLALGPSRLTGDTRRISRKLIVFGVPITWASAAFFGAVLLGLSTGAAVMFGAIVVVSGPTVVGPLLDSVRPKERLRQLLLWEGSLIDPIGGILGAVVFGAVVATTQPKLGAQLLSFLISLAIGLAGGAVGTGLLWLLLRKLPRGQTLDTAAQLASVIAVAAACDIFRDDCGLIAAIAMGLAASNIRSFNIAARRPFFETLVQLLIGLLFISISATVTPASLKGLLLPTLALIAILVLVTRPLVAAVATLRTDMPRAERAFVAWMAPRGIVAAATASTFSATLIAHGIDGAAKILPATFLVIVGTVTLYGLTARPVARRLKVVRRARTGPLLVGSDSWTVSIGQALCSAGLDVQMWAGPERQEEIKRAGLDVISGELIATATDHGDKLEGVTAAVLLTAEDNFNAMASTALLQSVDGPIYRLRPSPDSASLLAPYTGGETVFGPELDRAAVIRRHQAGAPVVTQLAQNGIPDHHDLLFVVRADGRLDPVTGSDTPTTQSGDTLVLLGPEPH